MAQTLFSSFPVALVIATLLVSSACGQGSASPQSSATASTSSVRDPYEPGLGEIMSLQQLRHTKLWLAGQAGNWALADYEIKELNEGFDDVLRWHPTHEDSPAAPKDLIQPLVSEPLRALHQAAIERNAKAFAQAYDALTAACNVCHERMNFGFNRVQRPATNPYPNQAFEPVRP